MVVAGVDRAGAGVEPDHGEHLPVGHRHRRAAPRPCSSRGASTCSDPLPLRAWIPVAHPQLVAVPKLVRDFWVPTNPSSAELGLDVAESCSARWLAAHDQQPGEPGQPVGDVVAGREVLHLLQGPGAEPALVGVAPVATEASPTRIRSDASRSHWSLNRWTCSSSSAPGLLGQVGEHAPGPDRRAAGGDPRPRSPSPRPRAACTVSWSRSGCRSSRPRRSPAGRWAAG